MLVEHSALRLSAPPFTDFCIVDLPLSQRPRETIEKGPSLLALFASLFHKPDFLRSKQAVWQLLGV